MFKGLHDTSDITDTYQKQVSLSQSQLSTQEPPDAEATDVDVLAEGAPEVDASSLR